MKLDPCELAEDLMPAGLDGSLSQQSRAYLEEHIKTCPACRSLYEAVREEREKKERVKEAVVYEKLRWRMVTHPIMLIIVGWILLLTVLGIWLTC